MHAAQYTPYVVTRFVYRKHWKKWTKTSKKAGHILLGITSIRCTTNNHTGISPTATASTRARLATSAPSSGSRGSRREKAWEGVSRRYPRLIGITITIVVHNSIHDTGSVSQTVHMIQIQVQKTFQALLVQ